MGQAHYLFSDIILNRYIGKANTCTPEKKHMHMAQTAINLIAPSMKELFILRNSAYPLR